MKRVSLFLGLVMGVGLLLSLSATTARAQVTTAGRLTGVVTDSKGALVPKAEIVATSETKAEFKATANGEGGWTIPSVPIGSYTISVVAPNFKTTVTQDVKVDAGQVATVNSVLEPGGASEQVVVSGGGEILQTESANVSTTIVGKQIVELPFVTRDALQLVLTLPGVQTPGTPRTSSINGLPKGSVNLTLDGANIQDNLLKSSDGFFATIMPKSDAIAEVTLSTAAGGAESSGEGAAQIRFVTKSGTNEWHGGVFWQVRNDYFNSNYYFNSIDHLKRDRIDLNQAGGRLGGPIVKNKIFFFVNIEEFRLPQTYGSALQTALTPDAMAGLFTYKDSTGQIQKINLYNLAAAQNPTLPATVRAF